MRGTVICTICATLQAGRRHKWLSYGHRIGRALTAKMWSPPTARGSWSLAAAYPSSNSSSLSRRASLKGCLLESSGKWELTPPPKVERVGRVESYGAVALPAVLVTQPRGREILRVRYDRCAVWCRYLLCGLRYV